MEWLDYREKLGLGFNDKEKEKYFYAIISNELRTVVVKLFCNTCG